MLTPGALGVAASAPFAQWHWESPQGSWGFFQSCSVEQPEQSPAELRVGTPRFRLCCHGRRGKAKPLTSYTCASSPHKALLLLLLALREAFPAFQSSAPERFSSLASPKHPQLPQGVLASKWAACKGPLPGKPSGIFWHFNQMLPASPCSQWCVSPFVFFFKCKIQKWKKH